MTPSSGSPIRVAIETRIVPGQGGGVEQSIIGTLLGLASVNDPSLKISIITRKGDDRWLNQYLSPQFDRISTTLSTDSHLSRIPPEMKQFVRKYFDPILEIRRRRMIRRLLSDPVPCSDGTIERVGTEVMHFTMQSGFRTSVPSIYQPHDLQHVHFPEFFSDDALRLREATYSTMADQASMVIAMTEWGKQDLCTNLGLPQEKVAVVPWAPVTEFYPVPSSGDLLAIRRKFNLPNGFLLYPAQTWAHKNHLRLIEAVAIARDRFKIHLSVICTGRQNSYWPEIEQALTKHRLRDQVRFLGYVSPLEIQSLYQLANGLAFPSLFEGWGMPITEAQSLGLPVACSNLGAIAEVAGDAAVKFDALDPVSICESLVTLSEDETLRRRLSEAGIRRTSSLSWAATAAKFAFIYHHVANDHRGIGTAGA